MKRRKFLLDAALVSGAGLVGSGALMAAAGVPVGRVIQSDPVLGPLSAKLGPKPTLRVRHPGREQGHAMRAAWSSGVNPWAQAATAARMKTHVLVAGSGAAGLTCAHRLEKAGQGEYLLLTGPAAQGNCASGQGTHGPHPQGAHYLPLPSQRSQHMRVLLHELGILKEGLTDEAPRYEESALVHAPAERVFKDGAWHDGLLPPLSGTGQEQWARLQKTFAAKRRDADKGVAVFGTPVRKTDFTQGNAKASRVLDTRPFSDWLDGQGITDPDLRWFMDYCCLDEYGLDSSHTSAWAGIHYFSSEHGKAHNAADGTVLTWPRGLGELTTRMLRGIPVERRRTASVLSTRQTRQGWEVLCLDDRANPFVVECAHLVMASPLFVSRRAVPQAFGGLEDATGPVMAPWVVANFELNRFPLEQPGSELAWDSVVCGSRSLGFVNATHQLTRLAKPEKTVFSAYLPLSATVPGTAQAANTATLVKAAREWANKASAPELMEMCRKDLDEVYGSGWESACSGVEFTVHGHAMAAPVPGFLQEPLAARAREVNQTRSTRLHFAHSDLSGYSVFEEAAYWGEAVAQRLL